MANETRSMDLYAQLGRFPQEYGYRYEASTSRSLLQILFRALANHNEDYLRFIFAGKVPTLHEDWRLSRAQDLNDDIEYTESARGRPCGHIFKSGDSVFRCKTCTNDDTAVLCARCFEASDHTGHVFMQTISIGNTGCCDCGDDEAWKCPILCGIHSPCQTKSAGKQAEAPALPDGLLESIRTTIGRVLDYIIDVISCSPENLRLPKSEAKIRSDEQNSRLVSSSYSDPPDDDDTREFAIVLWNDEKHTVPEVEDQVSRACRQRRNFGRQKAEETNDHGRSVLEHSENLTKLLDIAAIIEQIKITVTIRSSRDTFREQMCGTIIEWLNDLSGCAIGHDNSVMNSIIGDELLNVWQQGSEASNQFVGRDGLDDHDLEDQENSSAMVQRALFRRLIARRTRRAEEVAVAAVATTAGAQSDDDESRSEVDGDNDETEISPPDVDVGGTAMDIDLVVQAPTPVDRDSWTPLRMEGGAEVSEATIAGYPPPPPPPMISAIRPTIREIETSMDVTDIDLESTPIKSRAQIEIPPTPHQSKRKQKTRPPAYWLEDTDDDRMYDDLLPREDLQKRIRLDWLLLYDLRLWKTIRINLRDLYIKTLISSPENKRIFGLRFAGLYSVLGQLHLIADREPDLSIMNLSVQTFTTPSVIQNIVSHGNFMTTLLSLLYSFLTQRSVLHPWQISLDDGLVLENNAVTNRRMHHFFTDLHYMLATPLVRTEFREQTRYQLQFLDLVRLSQGICPNLRVRGEHVEYENDLWISAQVLTKDMNRVCRQYAEMFSFSSGASQTHSQRALRIWAKAVTINAIGGERMRFTQNEINDETHFKELEPFVFERAEDVDEGHSIIDFSVETGYLSFHHALHYTLSWLIDSAKTTTAAELESCLSFTADELRQAPPYKTIIPDQSPADFMLAVFDFPVRVCAWLAQMKAGMWVRNGLSLRHQMTTYRGVTHRDLAYQRDIFLVQTAFVVCDPSRLLANMLHRFSMEVWVRGNYLVKDDFEIQQQIDVAEDFIHLLIIVLSDRTALHVYATAEDAKLASIRRDIAHILCFKPLSFSELDSRFMDRAIDLEEYEHVLKEMTTYHAPEGISDTGTFELKDEHFDAIDPFTAHYSKNQRDEAEVSYRTRLAKNQGKTLEETIYEPRLATIETGIFQKYDQFVTTPLFAQIIFSLLDISSNQHRFADVPFTRIESLTQVVLHLILVAIMIDGRIIRPQEKGYMPSYVDNILHLSSELGITTIDILLKILDTPDLKACHEKVRLILRHIRQQRKEELDRIMFASQSLVGIPLIDNDDEIATQSRDETEADAEAKEARELKKKQALTRQAQVMAQFQQQQMSFMKNQAMSDWTNLDDAAVVSHSQDNQKTWEFPTGNCIMCQEDCNESQLYGTFGLVTRSTAFRQTDMEDSDLVDEVLSTPSDLDKNAASRRPFGLAGSNRKKITKRSFDGVERVIDHQGLARGYPKSSTNGGALFSGCGHIMHYSCFVTYCAATHRRQQHQIARQHAEKLKLNEFTCPLCKALGNIFLPVIWKGKNEVYPDLLASSTCLNDWLQDGIKPLCAQVCALSRPEFSSEVKEACAQYSSKNLPNSFAKMVGMNTGASLSTGLRIVSDRGLNDVSQATSHDQSEDQPQSSRVETVSPLEDLIAVLSRLRETLRLNSLDSVYESVGTREVATGSDSCAWVHTLANGLADSISIVEIAARGTASHSGHLIVHTMSGSSLTYLRVLSETVSSYLTIGSVHSIHAKSIILEWQTTLTGFMHQIFIGHPDYGLADELMRSQVEMAVALETDAFQILTGILILGRPLVKINTHHIIHICYVLEIAKVTLSVLFAERNIQEDKESRAGDLPDFDMLHTVRMRAVVQMILKLLCGEAPSTEKQRRAVRWEQSSSSLSYLMLYQLISRYALTFLRKVALLVHIADGIDFPEVISEESELDRLSKALRLPPLVDILAEMEEPLTNDQPRSIVSMMIHGWIIDWQRRDSQSLAFPKPSHPGIYELIGLPLYYETITYEAGRRRCQSKGGRLEDPCLCLFCGDFFCGQAFCCSRKGTGGCYQHMQICGRDIGLFLNIRKCMALYLHNGNGSWNYAPYLDKFGEPDPGLRRGRQLVLSQSRYDKLYRDVWLQQLIPTTIARRLEAEINNGGWETL